MRNHQVISYQGVSEIPDLNEAINAGRREQGRAVRAAFAWLAGRRPQAHGPARTCGGRPRAL